MFTKKLTAIRNVFFWILAATSAPALADSAAAWKDYQDGRNPMLELGLIVFASVIFFMVLGWINARMQQKKKKKTKRH